MARAESERGATAPRFCRQVRNEPAGRITEIRHRRILLGGSASFAHAVHSASPGAAVVYYGTSPSPDGLASVRAPVLGLYGENDARVDSTVPPADSAMKAFGKTFEYHYFPGAGHGFLRAQDAPNGANLAATRNAWPRTVTWFRKHLGD